MGKKLTQAEEVVEAIQTEFKKRDLPLVLVAVRHGISVIQKELRVLRRFRNEQQRYKGAGEIHKFIPLDNDRGKTTCRQCGCHKNAATHKGLW